VAPSHTGCSKIKNLLYFRSFSDQVGEKGPRVQGFEDLTICFFSYILAGMSAIVVLDDNIKQNLFFFRDPYVIGLVNEDADITYTNTAQVSWVSIILVFHSNP
jgi:hypothetical protein